jgi:hypothetical protein
MNSFQITSLASAFSIAVVSCVPLLYMLSHKLTNEVFVPLRGIARQFLSPALFLAVIGGTVSGHQLCCLIMFLVFLEGAFVLDYVRITHSFFIKPRLNSSRSTTFGIQILRRW